MVINKMTKILKFIHVWNRFFGKSDAHINGTQQGIDSIKKQKKICENIYDYENVNIFFKFHNKIHFYLKYK